MYLKRIKDLREDHDKYQKEIADILEITRQQYSLYELGDRGFKLEHIKKTCKILSYKYRLHIRINRYTRTI